MGEEGGDARGTAVDANLRSHVAVEIGKGAAIAKEKRKIAEARQALGQTKGKAKITP